MNKSSTHLLALVAAVLLPATSFAQANKPEPAGAGAGAKPGAAAEKPAKEEAKPTRPMPMNSRVDEIDAAAKTFTQITRDGRRVKHVITAKTEIFQGKDRAKFEDIKVGDMVAGSRLKKNSEGTEYEVIKITKFSAKSAKADAKK